MRKAPSRLSSNLDGPSEFFVEAATPTLGGGSVQLERAVTMGDGLVDFIDSSPEIKLDLLPNRLLFYVFTTLVFYTIFTVVAFIGVPVETIYEPIGSSKKSEERVEIYNTYSGYLMAFIETLLGMYMSSFLPVINVYAHNTLYFLRRRATTVDPRTGQRKPARKLSRNTHTAILFCLPIMIALTMGNSLRGLQAGQSSEGFLRIMDPDDLKKEQPTLELVKEKKKGNVVALAGAPKGKGVQDTILRNAIRSRATPFTFDTKSPCGEDVNEDTPIPAISDKFKVKFDVHGLDATSAVYGFVPQEWNGEAFANELQPKPSFVVTYKEAKAAMDAGKTLTLPPDFSISTAYEILIQGKLLIERAYGDAATDTYECSLSDGRYDLDRIYANNATNSTGNSPNTTSLPTNLTRTLREESVTHGTRRRRLEGTQVASSASFDTDEDFEDFFFEDEPEGTVGQDDWTFDEVGVRQCQGAVTSLFDMLEFDDPETRTLDYLTIAAGTIINKTVGSLSIEETEITFEKYELTKQIHIEAMRIDIPIVDTMDYGRNPDCKENNGDKCDSTYSYAELRSSFCGSDSCVFVDGSGTMKMQREVGITPYVVNMALDNGSIHYSSDFRGFYPTSYTRMDNTALLYGIGSFISGDEFGSSDPEDELQSPYIRSPRRHLRFTFAKVTWQTEDLAEKFNAECLTLNSSYEFDCTGLWMQLEQSDRFLFAGRESLPTNALAKADFRSPIALVQLNAPTLYVPALEQEVTLETLSRANFKSYKWDKTPYTTKTKDGKVVTKSAALRGDNCSMLMDSYLNQIADNKYELEKPMQVMYTSFFYYLMQNAAVTELNDTSIALNATTKTLDLDGSIITIIKSADKNDRLGNVKLKGDMQERSIRVSIPADSFKTSIAGCALVFVLTLLVAFVPARRAEHFDEDASTALQFVAMRSDEAYPDSVHKKTLLFPATGETVAFDELEVERMALVHGTERDRKIYL